LQRGRHDLGVQAERRGHVHQEEAGDADGRGQRRAPARVERGPVEGQAQRGTGGSEEIEHEQHRYEREEDPEQLVREVEVRPGGTGRVQRGGL
jgi:hypothetical protein